MIINLNAIYEYAKIIPIVIAVIVFAAKILKRLYELNVNVTKVIDRQEGQLSMHKGLQEALTEIKGIKLVCNERHKWDNKTDRRKA
jgi:inhibitor of KinA sporulation pathway (predicted exonuclease)